MQITEDLQSYQRCVSFCTADSYNLQGLAEFFREKGYLTRLLRDVLHVSHVDNPGDLFFFSHGCLVSWGYQKAFEDKVQEYVKSFAINPLVTTEIDYFYYQIGEKTDLDTHESLRLDIITLEEDDSQIKLAFSYGLSQSIKLESFEEAIQDAIKKNSSLPQELAKKGKIPLSRKAILQRMGEIFITRSSINLNIEYLDVPEFFWKNPNLEDYYITVSKFLDISSRVSALNQRLDVLQELLDILNTQVMHIHSSWLEAIIILLIFVEILISLFQVHVV
jgi:uncharacterized Rmd1/YagE family protein